VPEKAVSKEWIAVSGICTHAGCRIMQPLGQHGGFVCPCHGSEFDIYGHVIKGPAKRDLATVSHTVNNARLIFLGDAQRRD
jgi:ubiquinol-cytochrome c reductase iron-sulfur subunit